MYEYASSPSLQDPDLAHARSVSVSMLTSFTQVEAERIGRVYGGGVLKFELRMLEICLCYCRLYRSIRECSRGSTLLLGTVHWHGHGSQPTRPSYPIFLALNGCRSNRK